MNVKIFTDCNTNALELKVNRWLHEHPNVLVKHMLQSESVAKDGNSWVTLTIAYDEAK